MNEETSVFEIIAKCFIGKKVIVEGLDETLPAVEGILTLCDTEGNLYLTTDKGSIIIQKHGWDILREIKS